MMKQNVQRGIETRLAAAARAVLAQYHPKIIAITGSVGKTSTKDAIATVLESKFRVRATKGNYNNELGLPLTILGEESQGRSIFGWWKLFRRARKLAQGADQSYPQVLVLEMAMDRPGDLAKLAEIAKPDVSVVTNVGLSHLEFFPSIEAIAEEKATIVRALSQEGIAVLNADDPRTAAMSKLHKGKTMTFGIDKDTEVRAGEMHATDQIPEEALNDPDLARLKHVGVPLGTTFKIEHSGKSVPVRLLRMLGKQQVYAALAAASVGITQGMNLIEISQALLKYVPPLGRMNLIPALKNSIIIDDTYNSSPASSIAALDVLSGIKTRGRRICVLGDMAELGVATEQGHRDVGRHAAHTCDFAVFVGTAMKFAAEEAEINGLVDKRQTHVNDASQVEAVLQPVLQEGDVILVKGSQVMRMERVVKSLMAEPLRAPELVVRQTGLWESRRV
jgi:UDP-N-acetylmuramoyl-tripeptide--D-alanyl-D-alanine ligase